MTSYQKFALILASNYPGTSSQLRGCLVDAEKMRLFLLSKGFANNAIATIYNTSMTRTAMLQAFDNLVTRSNTIAASGQVPAFFFHYSGHGIRVWNSNQRTVVLSRTPVPPPDGFNDSDGDEAFVPSDFGKSGIILDDEVNDRLIKRLHPSTQLFALTDCCNSGSNLDLTYQGLSVVSSVGDLAPNVIHVAACRDSQTASELPDHGGVGTARFLTVMAQNPTTVPALRNAFNAPINTYGSVQNMQVSVSKASMVEGSIFSWLVTGAVPAVVPPSAVTTAGTTPKPPRNTITVTLPAGFTWK